jgi:hypothetical protein
MRRNPHPQPASASWPTYQGVPVLLVSPALYEALRKAGHDMGFYQRWEDAR